MIAVIDYGMGNMGSVGNALRFVGADHMVTDDPDAIGRAGGIILPGVGAFGDAMKNIRERGLEGPIKEFIDRGRPFLGICLGYQLLFEESEESPGTEGLGVLRGTVNRFPDDMNLKVPHMGWNTILAGDGTDILSKFSGMHVYFVHSYYADPIGLGENSAFTQYGIEFASAVEFENILASQFHPEKSGRDGLALLGKWTEKIK